jgi:hypothetical protein
MTEARDPELTRQVNWHGFTITISLDPCQAPGHSDYAATITDVSPQAAGFTFEFAEKRGDSIEEAVGRVVGTIEDLVRCRFDGCYGQLHHQHDFGDPNQVGPRDMLWQCDVCDRSFRWLSGSGEWKPLGRA